MDVDVEAARLTRTGRRLEYESEWKRIVDQRKMDVVDENEEWKNQKCGQT